jgi:hypothetical protein
VIFAVVFGDFDFANARLVFIPVEQTPD